MWHDAVDMFPAENRLRNDKDIARVLKSKAGAFDPVCGVKTAKNNLTVSRFAVVVGTKVSKSAVKRNHVRRQYRDIVEKKLSEISPGYDVILLVSKPALDLEYAAKETRILGVLRKAKLLAPGNTAHSAVPKNAVV